jgi:hypothetical protein
VKYDPTHRIHNCIRLSGIPTRGNAGGRRQPKKAASFLRGVCLMKITRMIHKTVVAFKPDRHPIYALLALAIMMSAMVALVVFGGVGVTIATTSAVAAVKAIR